MSNSLLQQLTASQTMSNIECCYLPISGLADYSPFQNELPHFDGETYSQLKGGESSSQFRWFTTAKIEL